MSQQGAIYSTVLGPQQRIRELGARFTASYPVRQVLPSVAECINYFFPEEPLKSAVIGTMFSLLC
jgi:hypothetical protein